MTDKQLDSEVLHRIGQAFVDYVHPICDKCHTRIISCECESRHVKNNDQLFQEIINLKKDKRDLESHLDCLRGDIEEMKNNEAKNELVALDEKKLFIYLLGITPRSVPLDREEIESLSKRICSKFGTPKTSSRAVPSKGLIIKILMDITKELHDKTGINQGIYYSLIEIYAQELHSFISNYKGE